MIMDASKRKFLFLLLTVCAVAVRAQFVTVDWSSHKVDSILPACSAVVDLPSDYAAHRYSAHIEYPEYQKMTKEEIARYSLQSLGVLPAVPEIDCCVGIQAKRPQLDVVFLPVVMRGGEYYRINSYKLVVDTLPSLSRVSSASQKSAAERYAPNSVLANGRWVRVAVKENGIHQITDNDLKKMGFKDPAKVRLYGYGGHILPETDLSSLPDDLVEVPLWRGMWSLLFYANATIKWEYNDGRYVHSQNVYSDYGCYFLTESDEAPMEFPSESLVPDASEVYTEFTDYALYEKELKSLCSYGRVLVDNYDYSQGRSASYKIPVAGVVDAPGVLDLSFASNGVDMSRVEVSLSGKNVGTISVPRCYSTEMGKIVSGKFTIGSGLGDNPVFKLSQVVTNSSVTGFLDYIRLNFRRKLALYASQTQFRGSLYGGNATFNIAGSDANTRVWEVSDVTSIRELKGSLNGGVYSVVAPAGYDRNLVVFNVEGKFPSVEYLGEVQNQNLHSFGQVDMVIIVPSNGNFLAAAERLAAAHREMDGITVEVVTAQQVYNEFSSGTPDVTAYRRLMKMLYDRASTSAEAPKYLLLFGDGWYDNRFITIPSASQDNYLLCYESLNSVDAVHSYVLEDYAGFLDDDEGGSHTRNKVDIGVGRIPVQTVGEANAVVDKLIAYMRNENAGEWQNVVLLLADDGDDSMPNQHMKDADLVADIMAENYPSYMVQRIYWDDYPVEKSATGNRYPAVTKAIYDRLDKGALVVNYSGHGSSNLLSHEMVWKASDMSALTSPHVPFWVTASCDIGPFDMGDNSVAESALLNGKGGAIGLLTTTRTVLQSYNSVINREFSKLLLEPVNTGVPAALGDVVRRAKCNVISYGSDLSENKLQFVLLGDPALRLKTPEYKFVIERFNGVSPEENVKVQAGASLCIEGYMVARDGVPVEDFTGVLYTTLFDCIENVETRDNTGLGSHSYQAFTKQLFSGCDSIVNGHFSVTLPVPMDISYRDAQGLLNLFAVDSTYTRSAQGSFTNFTVGGTAGNIDNDGTGPEMKLYLNTPSFTDGDEVNATPCLWVELYDENGINTVGSGIGHDIVAIVDNNPKHTYNLNGAYTPVVGDYTRGTVVMPLDELEPGEHTLMVRAWDLLNNSSVAELRFFVEPSLAPDFMELSVNPSPVVAGMPATFTLLHDRPQSELEVTIEIFNMQGQVIWSNTEKTVFDGVEYRYEWDCTAGGGQPMPTGVYLVRAYIASDGSVSSSRTGKIVVINNK